MPDITEDSKTWIADRMSITKELGSKRLLQYFPVLDRIQAVNSMHKAYEHNRITSGKHIDNSTATGLHQEPQLGLQHGPQNKLHHDLQHGAQHRRHHCLHHCRHLSYDIIYTALSY